MELYSRRGQNRQVMERSPREIIDKYYPADSEVRGILITHSRMVASEALAIAARKGLDLDEVDIVAAAMLHDVGIGSFLPNRHESARLIRFHDGCIPFLSKEYH